MGPFSSLFEKENLDKDINEKDLLVIKAPTDLKERDKSLNKNLDDFNNLNKIINNISIISSYGKWTSNNDKKENNIIKFDFILLVSLNYSNKQSEYDFLISSSLERNNFKKQLINNISKNEYFKKSIKEVIINYLKKKNINLNNNTNIEINFNNIIDGINVNCIINLLNNLENKNKLELLLPHIKKYIKIDFLKELKIQYYDKKKIIEINPYNITNYYNLDINNNINIKFQYVIKKQFDLTVKENFINNKIFIEHKILENLLYNINRPIIIEYKENSIDKSYSILEIKFKIEKKDIDTEDTIKMSVDKLYNNLFKMSISSINNEFTFYDLLNFSPFDSDYMYYFINNLCIKSDNIISNNCNNNININIPGVCSKMSSLKNKKNIIIIKYKNNNSCSISSSSSSSTNKTRCMLSPNEIQEVKTNILNFLKEEKCNSSDIIYLNNNIDTDLNHIFKLTIFTEQPIKNLLNLIKDNINIDYEIEKKKELDTSNVIELIITINKTNIYSFNIDSEIYDPCNNKKQSTNPNARLKYLEKLLNNDFKYNIDPTSELFESIKSHIYGNISTDEFSEYIKNYDEYSKHKIISYRTNGLIYKFLKNFIEPEKIIIDKIKIINEFNKLSDFKIKQKYLYARLFYILNNYKNNNEFDLNYKIKDNSNKIQSKYNHLINIFKENFEIELEKLMLMNVEEKYKYFYITKGNIYDNPKKTQSELNELELTMITKKLTNNQINEYILYLENKIGLESIIKHFKTFMSNNKTFTLISNLYNKTLIGGNNNIINNNKSLLNLIFYYKFFNSIEYYKGQNINRIILNNCNLPNEEIYTIGNSGHFYKIIKANNIYQSPKQIISRKYYKFNFISIHILFDFCFVLTDNDIILYEKLSQLNSNYSNWIEYNINNNIDNKKEKFKNIYVNNIIDKPSNINDFNIYLSGNHSICKLKLNNNKSKNYIYKNEYIFDNKYFKYNKKVFCIINSINKSKEKNNNILFINLDDDFTIKNFKTAFTEPENIVIKKTNDDIHSHVHSHPHHKESKYHGGITLPNFNTFDINKDGYLTKTDIEKIFTPLFKTLDNIPSSYKSNRFKEKIIEDIFTDFDQINTDQKISEAEFKKYYNKIKDRITKDFQIMSEMIKKAEAVKQYLNSSNTKQKSDSNSVKKTEVKEVDKNLTPKEIKEKEQKKATLEIKQNLKPIIDDITEIENLFQNFKGPDGYINIETNRELTEVQALYSKINKLKDILNDEKNYFNLNEIINTHIEKIIEIYNTKIEQIYKNQLNGNNQKNILFNYLDNLINKIKEQIKLVNCNGVMYLKYCPQEIKIKELIINNFLNKTDNYYYIIKDFSDILYIGSELNINKLIFTSKLNFKEYTELSGLNLKDIKLENIYYNNTNFIIFTNNYYLEFLKLKNKFILTKKVELNLDFDLKNIYVCFDDKYIVRVYLYGTNKTLILLDIKLNSIYMTIDSKLLEYKGIMKDNNNNLNNVYFINSNIKKGEKLLIDSNLINLNKETIKNKLNNLLNNINIINNVYYEHDKNRLYFNYGRTLENPLNHNKTEIMKELKSYGFLYKKKFENNELKIPFDEYNINMYGMLIDYNLSFYVKKKNNLDIITSCLKVKNYNIWLKPYKLENNNIYYDSNLLNIDSKEQINILLKNNNIELVIYYNGYINKKIILKNIVSNNSYTNQDYLFKDLYKIFYIEGNKIIEVKTDYKTKNIIIPDINKVNIIIIPQNIQNILLYKNIELKKYIEINKTDNYLDFNIYNFILKSNIPIKLKILRKGKILQNKLERLDTIFQKFLLSLTIEELYNFFNYKTVPENKKHEIKHLVLLFRINNISKLYTYINKYSLTNEFSSIVNEILLNLNNKEKIEFSNKIKLFKTTPTECTQNKIKCILCKNPYYPITIKPLKIEIIEENKIKFKERSKLNLSPKTLYILFGYVNNRKINKNLEKNLVYITIYNNSKYFDEENLNNDFIKKAEEILIEDLKSIIFKLEYNYKNYSEQPDYLYDKIVFNKYIDNNKISKQKSKSFYDAVIDIFKGGTGKKNISEKFMINMENIIKKFNSWDKLDNKQLKDSISELFSKKTLKEEKKSLKTSTSDKSVPPQTVSSTPKRSYPPGTMFAAPGSTTPATPTKPETETSTKCTNEKKKLNEEIKKLKIINEDLNNQKRIIDTHNLWNQLLKDKNYESNFNKWSSDKQIPNNMLNDYNTLNNYIKAIKENERKKYENKLLEEQQNVIKNLDNNNTENISFMEIELNNKIESLKNMYKVKNNNFINLKQSKEIIKDKDLKLKKNNRLLENKELELTKNKNLLKICNNKDKKQKELIKSLNKKIKNNNQIKNIKNDISNVKNNINNVKNNINNINVKQKELNNIEIKNQIKNELKDDLNKFENKKIKKKCKDNIIDCLLKDEEIHTEYKKSFKLLNNWNTIIPKPKVPCKPRKKCNICPRMAKGIPNSIKLNIDNTEENFKIDYNNKNLDGVPECPYSVCDKCDIDIKYKMYDTAFNNNLINKYGINKE